jgi:hypothetical protein
MPVNATPKTRNGDRLDDKGQHELPQVCNRKTKSMLHWRKTQAILPLRSLLFGFWVQDSVCRLQESEFKVQGARFRVPGSRFRVQGSGFRA